MSIDVKNVMNKVDLSGILFSADVRMITFETTNKETGNKENKEAVMGKLKIITGIDEETGAKSTQTAEIFINKYTKNGTINKTVETLDELIGGIKTSEEIKAIKKKDSSYKNEVIIYDKSSKEPVKMYCSVWNSNKEFAPKFSTNRYVSQNEVKENVRISGGNVTIKPFEEGKHQLFAQFDIDCKVKDIQEELDKEGTPTGRALLTVMIPTIGSDKELDLTELKLVAGILPPTEQYPQEIDLGAMFLEEIEEGVDLNIQGQMINSAKVIEIVKEVRFGRPRVETKTDYLNEYQIVGADYLEEDTFEEEDIRELRKAINIKKQEMLEQAEEQSDEPVRSTARGLGAKPNNSKRRNGFF